MALKFKDIKKINGDEREKMLEDLKIELIKSKTGTGKTSGKIKEIKKTRARLLTLKNMNKK